jgi:hypothetical protein
MMTPTLDALEEEGPFMARKTISQYPEWALNPAEREARIATLREIEPEVAKRRATLRVLRMLGGRQWGMERLLP